MRELLRAASLAGYLEVMAQLGCDPRPLLREQGLSTGLLSNPEQLIPARAAARLLERSAAVSGCEALGLRMTEGRALANLGAASLLIALQPSLRHALTALKEFRARINSMLVLHLEELDDTFILREDITLSGAEPSRQSSDLALGVLMRLCAEVLGPEWAPRLACFSHAAPATADLVLFNRVFRCPLQFDSELNGIVLRPSDLDRPNPRADAQMAQHARHLLDMAMNLEDRSARQDVDQMIRLLMPAGRASIQHCAATMGVTVRTLQRMLDAEGTSFSDLLNQARMQLAAQYLSNPRVRITDVADRLGYGSIGAFSRWHKRMFGQPPLALRG